MSVVISESRFYMWRAVFAMAHVDGTLSEEERALGVRYLDNAEFSQEQAQILKEDLEVPQSVGDMLQKVSELTDQADFFQFSHMLAWKDGDVSAQEKTLMDRFNAGQVQKFNKAQLAENIREARKAAILRRALEDDKFHAQAKDVSGLANVLSYVLPWESAKGLEAPDADMFNLWRAVFSLVHADDDLAEEERDYIEAMMAVFHFSEDQKAQIQGDLETPPDIIERFKALKNVRHRKQFFVLARTVIWCDGVFHEQERAAIDDIQTALGTEVEAYQNELKWLERRPDGLSDDEAGQQAMMQEVVRQMLNFYKEQGDDN